MEAVISLLTEYLLRFSVIAGNLINCGPILNWLELDNRGNRLIVTDDSAINTPAVAAAYVTKRYIAQAADEISFEVCDMISVIDMPPPEESIWWRGKRGFEVGFFPSECVEVIGDKVPPTIHIPKAPTKPVLRKHGKLIAFFRSFILSRPSRRKLKQSGILKERVFGCDLGEHLLNSGHEIPMVLKCCADFIEDHGIVDGIYRLSGVTSNIQKLRNTFDEDRVPDLNDEAILQDIHSVASLLKMYFRELPNPLLTYQLYDKFVFAVQSDEEVRLLNIRDVVQQLPPPHYRTLEYLVKHLTKVASHGVETGMTPKNVAIVWAPNLLRSKDLEVGGVAALQVVGVQAVVTEFLIRYSDLIFNDKMPVFPPCPGSTGTPKRNRPKSLAISTPTKLLSLEEARSRALGAGTQCTQKYIEVGGGPATLPSKYHTIIDLPDRKRSTTKHKKSPSGWKSFFGKGKSSQSTRDREKSKSRRKASATPSDPGITVSLSGKAVTETDVSYNNNRLRSVKSAESLVSSGAASSHRNSSITDSGSIGIPTSVHNGKHGHSDGEDILSSSLGAVPTTHMRQSPHSHIRSISHDSYFEYTLERHREEHPTGELSTIMSEDNDEDSEKLALDDFQDVARDLDLMKLRYMDQDADISVMGQLNDGAGSTTLDETTASIAEDISDLSTSGHLPERLDLELSARETDGPDTLGSESLQEQLSLEFEDGHCDIVGDIQKEVAAALHWDQAPLSNYVAKDVASHFTNINTTDQKSPLESDLVTEQIPEHSSKGHSRSSSKVVVERYGSEKTVIVEVHATEDSSAEEEDGNNVSLHQHSCKPVVPSDFQKSSIAASSEIKDTDVDFSIVEHQPILPSIGEEVVTPGSAMVVPASSVRNDYLHLDFSETKNSDLVSECGVELHSNSFPDSLEYSNVSYKILGTSTLSTVSDDDSFLDSLAVRSSTEEPLSFSEIPFEHGLANMTISPSMRVVAVDGIYADSLSASQVKAYDPPVCSVPIIQQDGVQESVPKIFVRESTLPATDEQPVHRTAQINSSVIHSAGLEPSQFSGLESDSSPGSQATSHDEVSSNTSPSGTGDLFGYSVLMNEEEPVQIHATEVSKMTENDPSSILIASKQVIESDLISNANNAKRLFSTDSSRSDVDDRASCELKKQSTAPGDGNKQLTGTSVCSVCPLDAEISASNLQSPISPCREAELYMSLPKSCAYSEKLSPVSPIEESKRKFESEIGRDILRERKLKLELEKIQLEHQKLEKLSPSRTDELSSITGSGSSKPLTIPVCKGDAKSVMEDTRLPASQKGTSTSEIASEHVELRQTRNIQQEPQHSQEGLLKRLSDPVLLSAARSLEHSYLTEHSEEGKKRNSEPPPLHSPASKCARPERKASVKELMSKFEGRPKVEIRADHKEALDCIDAVVPSATSQSPLTKNLEHSVNLDSFGVEANQSRVCEPFHSENDNTHSKFSVTLSSVCQTELDAAMLDNQLCDLNHTVPPISVPGVPSTQTKVEISVQEPKEVDSSEVPKVSDPARRERIDRYKEERRAQLRERIKSESFRGEQDSQSEYLVRLKMKASSPTKLVGGSSEDVYHLPTSPVRRARLSSASLASPTEAGDEKMDVFLSRRRSFNTRGTQGGLTSPSGSEDLKDSTPVSPRKVAREKRCGLPVPPSSPKKGPAVSEVVNPANEIITTTEIGKVRCGHEVLAPSSEVGVRVPHANRPKDLFVDKHDSDSTRRSSLQRKESPVDSASKRLKSPMKERTFNLPPSPTKDKFISSRSDHPSRKDIKSKSSPVTENLPANQTSKSKIPKSVAPVPGPRKIKEVAALFEPEVPLSSRDQPSNTVSVKPRPLPKPSAGILQRQLSLNANEAHDSSSLLSTNQRWKPKQPAGP